MASEGKNSDQKATVEKVRESSEKYVKSVLIRWVSSCFVILQVLTVVVVIRLPRNKGSKKHGKRHPAKAVRRNWLKAFSRLKRKLEKKRLGVSRNDSS